LQLLDQAHGIYRTDIQRDALASGTVVRGWFDPHIEEECGFFALLFRIEYTRARGYAGKKTRAK
jgi:hypothetical protein